MSSSKLFNASRTTTKVLSMRTAQGASATVSSFQHQPTGRVLMYICSLALLAASLAPPSQWHPNLQRRPMPLTPPNPPLPNQMPSSSHPLPTSTLSTHHALNTPTILSPSTIPSLPAAHLKALSTKLPWAPRVIHRMAVISSLMSPIGSILNRRIWIICTVLAATLLNLISPKASDSKVLQSRRSPIC
jgi:hypothetical protein